ncbi:MAG: plsX [Gammaproteobacteria bacterium]|jgi:glycerol-3-phosphate acyltransferase PlsX|nr:plsX [Gammaproteobacteria bacterium]
MGGDYGPEVTIPAALQALRQYPNLKLRLVGDEELLTKLLKLNSEAPGERLFIQHASQEVAMDESPVHALRTKKDSSMRVAINQVKEGKADACVSAGNTGALMATAKFVLKTLPGIDRPAIISSFPSRIPGKLVRMLDLGGNVDCTDENLVQFAMMGSALVSAIDNNERPSVALLNIGEEEIKGNEQVKRTAQLLSNNPFINYCGYIEADRIFSGDVNVIVCDGFVGNISLKSMEGMARFIADSAKGEFKRTLFSKLVALCTFPVLKRLKESIDPGRHNGANFIGLRGIVVKSHGGANVWAFAQAISEAIKQVEADVPNKISREMSASLPEEERKSA